VARLSLSSEHLSTFLGVLTILGAVWQVGRKLAAIEITLARIDERLGAVEDTITPRSRRAPTQPV